MIRPLLIENDERQGKGGHEIGTDGHVVDNVRNSQLMVFLILLEDEEGTHHHAHDAPDRSSQTSNRCSQGSFPVSEPHRSEFTHAIAEEGLETCN